MRVPALVFLFAVIAAPASAENDYDRCLELVKADPGRARELSLTWYQSTGDIAALHCEALALSAEGAFLTAAEKLAALARAPELSTEQGLMIALQSAILYRREGDDQTAEAVLTPRLSETAGPAAAPAFAERAMIRGARGDWRGARADLDAALRVSPYDGELLALRAAARRRMGDNAGALADALAAVKAEPGLAGGWLELGASHAATGAKAPAREAYLRAISAAPDSPAAQIARAALQDLDLPAAPKAPPAEPEPEPEPAVTLPPASKKIDR